MIRIRAHYASVFAKATPDKLPDAAPARVLTHTLPAGSIRVSPSQYTLEAASRPAHYVRPTEASGSALHNTL